MARPWQTIETVQTADGALELRRRGEDDYMITIDGRSLMISRGNRSEIVVAEAAMHAHREPRSILIGGLGMGYTLRAALDAAASDARITVCELTPDVVRWCEGELAPLSGHALADERVETAVGDVADIIAKSTGSWDVIILDLYEGPHEATQRRDDPFYGAAALDHTRRALRPGGIFSVWSEEPDRAFEQRLSRAGFRWEKSRPGRGRRHCVYLAQSTVAPQ